MNTDYRIANAACDVWDLAWERARIRPEFPCDVESLILYTFQLEVYPIDQLDVEGANRWAFKRGLPYQFLRENRRLQGCIYPSETGTILVDASASGEEQRLTLAHELGHYLFDYYYPREQAIEELGPTIREVLDGKRQPTLEERVHGVLAHTPIGMISHLMERPEQGLVSNAVWEAEDRADQFALELLAPAVSLKKRMMSAQAPRAFRERLVFLENMLYAEYGLPHSITTFYAEMLLAQLGEPRMYSWLEGRESDA